MALSRQRAGSDLHVPRRNRSGATPRTLERPGSSSAVENIASARRRNSSSAVETVASARRGVREADGADANTPRPVVGTWQFMTQRGTWQQHSVTACRQLERAFQTSKPTCSISTPAGRIEVDLNSMTQHLSQGMGSNVSRRIRRLLQEAPESGTTPPVVAAHAPPAPTQPSTGTEAAATAAPPRRPSRPTPKAAPMSSRPAVARSSSQSSVARTAASAKSPPLRRTPSTSAPVQRRNTPDDEGMALAIALSLSEHHGEGRFSPLAAAGESIIVLGGRGSAGGSRGSNARCMRDEELALLLAREEELLGAQLHAASNSELGAFRGDMLDVDRMGYEELLALGDRIGNVDRPSRPTQLDVSRLPTRRVTDASKEENECAICCDCYDEGDELRILPCFHAFHIRCIDQWLLSGAAGSKLCPVCNSEIGI